MNKKSNSFIKITSVLMALLLLVIAAGPASAAQLPVDLGTAGDFVILSDAGITTTGTTAIVGDIGTGPAVTHTAITGFDETLDASNEFSTSDHVTGNVYAYDYSTPTPAKMNTAILNMRAAYGDAAGRTIPDQTGLGAGDISTMTIAPGLYKWTTGVNIDDRGVTLSGGANDVWIFQMEEDLTVASGAVVRLSGGAQAKNIFWQVGGGTGVTLGTTSVFNGNILAIKGIIMNNGATLNGRALAETAVTLDANVVSLLDTTPPVITLLGTSPINIVVGSVYTDAGATALDDVDGDITDLIVTPVDPVDTAVLGTYTVTYDVTDAAGNDALQVTRTVNVVDTTQPVFKSARATSDTNIDIVFNQNITIVGTPIWATDVTATGMTATGGSADGKILHVTVNSLANTAYTATDLAIVQDTVRNSVNGKNLAIDGESIDDGQAPAAPVINAPTSPTNDITPTITGTGENGTTVVLNSSINGLITVTAVVADGNWSITTNALTNATHSLTAVQTDAAGNPSAVSGAKALIVDTTPPVITLIGNSSIDVEGGSVYIDAGATALDNVDGYINGSIVNVTTVNTTVLDIYTVTYDVTDAAGNPATQVTRTVNVVDTTLPVITLNGVNPVWVVVGSPYTDEGATALDIVDGYRNNSIVNVSTVNTAVPGIYNVTYNVNDTAGNHALQQTRTVNVVDLDLENSTVVAVPTIVNENGNSTSTITVTARNNINQGVIPGAIVVLTSDRLEDTIVLPTNTTDSNGNATFSIRSNHPGKANLTATVLGKQLNHKAIVTFGFDSKLGLNKGWNLVSVPRTLANSSVSALGTNNVDMIYYYDTVSGVWKYAYYTSGNWSGTLTTIDDGKGYWMNATDGTEVQVVLKTLDPLQLPPEYPLKAGWNMVGYTSQSLDLTTDIDIYFDSLRNPGSGVPIWVSAYIWENGGYRQAKPELGLGGGNYFTNAMRTEGYWVYLNSDGKLVP